MMNGFDKEVLMSSCDLVMIINWLLIILMINSNDYLVGVKIHQGDGGFSPEGWWKSTRGMVKIHQEGGGNSPEGW